MSTYVWGVRIYMADHMTPLSQTTGIGLYNVNSVLTGNAAAGQKVVAVTDGTKFTALTAVKLKEGATQEECFIASIASNNLTMRDNLTNSYTSAGSATVYADSEIRWLQNQIASVSNWNYSMIVDKGMDKIVRSVDLSNGGNFATINGFSVTVKNTSSLWATLQTTLDVSMIGKLAQVVLYTDTTLSVQGTFICESTAWDKTTYSIQMRGAWKRRDANIVTEENVDGKPTYADVETEEKITIPATYGKWNKYPASIVKSKYINDTITLEKLISLFNDNSSGFVSDITDEIIKTRNEFPVIGTVGSLAFKVQLGNSGLFVGAFNDISNPLSSSMYMRVVLGDHSVGENKRITKIEYIDYYTIKVTVNEYCSVDLDGSATGDGAWVTFVEYSSEYSIDDWPCNEWLDYDGNSIGNTSGLSPNLSVYINEKTTYSKIDAATTSTESGTLLHTHRIYEQTAQGKVKEAKYGFYPIPDGAIKTSDANVNKTQCVGKYLFGDKLDEVYTYLSKPITLIELLNETPENFDNSHLSGTLTKVKDGLYKFVDGASYHPFTDCDVTIANNSYAIDRDNSTVCTVTLTDRTYNTKTSLAYYVFGVKVSLPSQPNNYSYDNAYLAMKITSKVRPQAFNLQLSTDIQTIIASRGFIGRISDVLDYDTYGKLYWDVDNEDSVYGLLDCCPDNYFITPRTLNELYYYVLPELTSTIVGNRYRIIKGRTVYPLASSNDAYKAIDRIAIMLVRYLPNGGDSNNPQDLVDYMQIAELGVLFEKKLTLGDKFYTNIKGRIYNSTWGGAVVGADMISGSNNMYEHLCRLQNWRERSTMPVGGWGKGYCDEALIKTGATTDGSLRHNDVIDSFYPTRQITETSDGWISKLKQSLCREFWYCGYIDASGYECIKKIPTTEGQLTAPAELITYADIRLANSKITIEEPDPSRIFPEPFVRFNKNMATDEYESIVRVHNVTATSATGTPQFNQAVPTTSGWVEAPTGMYSATASEELWTKCEQLWDLSSVINEPSNDLTNLEWANGGDHAQAIAKNYMDNWVNWMRLKRCTFKVHFLTTAGGGTAVRSWTEGQRFRLQLVHETSDAVVECIAYRIAIDTYSPYHIEVSAYMLETTKLPDDYYIVDTMDDNNTNWVDTMTAYGDDNDKIDQM